MPPYGPFTAAASATNKTIHMRETRKTLDREYLLCLVLTQDAAHRQKLLNIGLNSVEHFMPAAFYAAMNNADEASLQSILIQADAGEDAADWAVRVQRVRQAWRRQVGFRIDTSFRWGCVGFKGTRKKLQDGDLRLGYQCDCPRRSHSKVLASGNRTFCTWTMTYSDEDSRLKAIRTLKWWVSQAWKCTSKRAHQALRNSVPEELPTVEELDKDMPAEGRVVTEDEAEAGPAEPPPRKRARGRADALHVAAPAAKGKSKAKPKPKGRARGRGRGGRASAPSEHAHSDPPTDSSDSSSSSSDSSSSDSD